MKTPTQIFTSLICLALCGASAQAANKYFDANGTAAGGGDPCNANVSGGANWSSSDAGTDPATWVSGNTCVFSAGTPANTTATLNSGITAAGIVVEDGKVVLTGASAITIGAGPITVNSGATLSINSSVRITASAGSVITINGGTVEDTNPASAGSFVPVSQTIVLSGGGTLSYTTAGVLNIVQTTTTISGTGPLTKEGDGILAIASACTYSGATIINHGTLRIRSATNRLPTGTDVTVNSPGVFDPALSQQVNTITVNSGGAITYSGSGTLTIAGSGNSAIDGVISDGSYYGKITKSGGGTLTLSQVNTYDGQININSGTVTVTSTGKLIGDGGDVYVNGGTLNLNNTAQTIEDLNGTAGTINLNGNGSGHTLTSIPADTTTCASTIAGVGGINYNGATYTLTLSGNNSYSGGTTVTAGTVEGSTSSSLGNGNVAVASGAFLKLSHASAMNSGKNLTLAAAPPASTVNLNFSGTETINALYFGTTAKAQGTWGSTTSTAQHKNAAFTSAGLLLVSSNPSGVATMTTLSPIADACVGSASSLSAAVTGTSPTGDVEFFDGATSLGTAPLSGGTATKSVTLSLAGSPHSITAKYLGDDGNNQSTSGSQSATVIALPTASVDSATICVGASATLTATTSASGPSYLWSPGGATTVSITVSPSSTASYTVAVTDGVTGCHNSGSGTVTVNPLPTVSVNSETICAGGSATLTATTSASGPTYLWSPGGDTTASVTVTPASTATYTVTVTDGVTGCAKSGSGTVTVDSVPSASNPTVNSPVCIGSAASFSVTATGGDLSYAWRKLGTGWGSGNQWQLAHGDNSGFFVFTSSANGSPSSGNIDTSGQSWGMYANTGDTASAVRAFGASLGVGQTIQLDMDNGYIDSGTVGIGLQNASGDNVWEFYFHGGDTSYTINESGGPTATGIGFTADGLRIAFTLTSASTFSVAVTTPLGGTTSTFTGSLLSPGGGQAITQLRLFNADAGGGSSNDAYFNSIVIGAYDDNAGNYTAWNNGDNFGNGPISGANTSNYTINPATAGDSGNYDVVVQNGCGQATSTPVGLTVNPLPSAGVNSATICAGASATLTATTVRQSDLCLESGRGHGASITVSPSSTASYAVTVTDGVTGCANSGSGTVTVNPLPSASANSATICAGGSATLTASSDAASPTYAWSPGGATTASITVSPSSTASYTVTVTDGVTGCANSGSGTVTVNALPTAGANSATICAGGSATLTASSDASSPTYAWSPGGATTASITVSPSSTASYTVTVTDGVTGCGNSGSGTVTVNPLPSAGANSATICAGGSATLTASSDAATPSYAWSPGGATTASITVSPSSTTSCTVTVTDGVTGCANSGSGTVTVNPLPSAGANSATICAGGSATLTASSDAASPTYAWSPGGATTASITVSPSSTASYTVTVTDGVTGCANSGSGTVTVNPLPTAGANSATICAGDSATLTASSDASSPTYAWSPGGATTASITVSPSSTTSYTVTVTDGVTGCANNGSGTVTVNVCSPLTITGISGTTLSYSGGSGTFTLYTSSDVTLSLSGWTQVGSPQTGTPGTFTIPAVGTAGDQVYYIIKSE